MCKSSGSSKVLYGSIVDCSDAGGALGPTIGRVGGACEKEETVRQQHRQWEGGDGFATAARAAALIVAAVHSEERPVAEMREGVKQGARRG